MSGRYQRIRVRAFGLNRSEMFTRQGHSPSVRFPRVLGIECVGTVETAPGTDLAPGQKVAAVMGEMGRAYDGGYAEYALVPRLHVLPVVTSLPWEIFGALPETYLTAWGSLVDTMEIEAGDIGATTLRDSLRAARAGGLVCQTGLLGNAWVLERFEPLVDMPSGVRLTVYRSATISTENGTAPLQAIVDGVATGRYRANLDRVFAFDEIVQAHRYMEENRAKGKLVVTLDDKPR